MSTGPDNLPDLTKILTIPLNPPQSDQPSSSQPIPTVTRSPLSRNREMNKTSPSKRSQSADGLHPEKSQSPIFNNFGGKLKTQEKIIPTAKEQQPSISSLPTNIMTNVNKSSSVSSIKTLKSNSTDIVSKSQSYFINSSTSSQSALPFNPADPNVLHELPKTVKALKSRFSYKDEQKNQTSTNIVNPVNPIKSSNAQSSAFNRVHSSHSGTEFNKLNNENSSSAPKMTIKKPQTNLINTKNDTGSPNERIGSPIRKQIEHINRVSPKPMTNIKPNYVQNKVNIPSRTHEKNSQISNSIITPIPEDTCPNHLSKSLPITIPYQNESHDPFASLKPGSPPLYLYTDGSKIQEGEDVFTQEVATSSRTTPEVSICSKYTPEVEISSRTTPEVAMSNKYSPEVEVSSKNTPEVEISSKTTPEAVISSKATPEKSPGVDTGGVKDISTVLKPKTNLELSSDSFCSVLSSDSPSLACQDSILSTDQKKHQNDAKNEVIRSTPSPRPVRPNSLAVIPLSSLVDRKKPSPTNNPSEESVVCEPNIIQPYVDIQTSFSLAPALSKRRLKVIFENISPVGEDSDSTPAVINMKANGSWYENNQINDFVSPQLEPSCNLPVDPELKPTHNSETSFDPSNTVNPHSKLDSNISSNDETNVVIEDIITPQSAVLCGENDSTIVKRTLSPIKTFDVSSLNTNSSSPSTSVIMTPQSVISVEEKTKKRPFSSTLDTQSNSSSIRSKEDILHDIESMIVTDISKIDNETRLTNEMNLDEAHEPIAKHSKLTSSVGGECVTLDDIYLDFARRKSSLKEEDIESYISEMERSLSDTPKLIDNIDIGDLQPPEFYRNVSRNSTINDEIFDETDIFTIEDECMNKSIEDTITNVFSSQHVATMTKTIHNGTISDHSDQELNSQSNTYLQNTIVSKESLPEEKPPDDEKTQTCLNRLKEDLSSFNINMISETVDRTDTNSSFSKTTQDTIVNRLEHKKETYPTQTKMHIDINADSPISPDSEIIQINSGVHLSKIEQNTYPQSSKTIQTPDSYFPSVTMTEGSREDSNTISPNTHTEGAPVYTAEVKVVQRASLPPTPSFEIPEGKFLWKEIKNKCVEKVFGQT